MNIFVLDHNPVRIPHMMCDKHVVKMVLETGQMLSTAHHVLDGPHAVRGIYKKTHENHPCNKWVRESDGNYTWLLFHFYELCKEYTLRYGKIHKTSVLTNKLSKAPDNILLGPTTPFVFCGVSGKNEVSDVIESYRDYYYIKSKTIDMKWTNRRMPEWFVTRIREELSDFLPPHHRQQL